MLTALATKLSNLEDIFYKHSQNHTICNFLDYVIENSLRLKSMANHWISIVENCRSYNISNSNDYTQNLFIKYANGSHKGQDLKDLINTKQWQPAENICNTCYYTKLEKKVYIQKSSKLSYFYHNV